MNMHLFEYDFVWMRFAITCLFDSSMMCFYLRYDVCLLVAMPMFYLNHYMMPCEMRCFDKNILGFVMVDKHDTCLLEFLGHLMPCCMLRCMLVRV